MSKPEAEFIRAAELRVGGKEDQVDFIFLRAMFEEASKVGACRALASLGLDDERARRDMDELRELLVTWRDVKRSAWRTAARWVVRVILASMMVAMAFRLDLLKLLEP